MRRFLSILHPYALQKLETVASTRNRFVHYTRAEVAINILRTKEIWMRNASCMNDFLEVEYGLECLFKAYAATKFKSVLDGLWSGLGDEIEKLFNGWIPHFRNDTYLTCVSEHLDDEDTFGRLSMWRAYGAATGVALVFNNSVFLNTSDGFGIYSSPVAYWDHAAFEKELLQIADNVKAETDFLRSVGKDEIVSRMFNMFKFASFSTKHPGFSEEREWRVIYSPKLEESKYVTKEIQTIGGVPQAIFKIPLKDIPEVGFTATIASLLDRIIIGPTEFPLAIKDAFVNLLEDAQVPDASKKVWISDIPLRR